ncbi:MAG: major facilitator superfamily 1 [Frankiales bacterium]|nr:major facilitator superfamily 1 [Frankiales bacterium]
MSARLPPAVRRLIAGVAVSSFGTGLTLPFTLILLHEVRGIPLPTVGLLLAVPGVVGLCAVPVSGTLIDRLGARAVLRAALVLQAGGSALLAVADTPLQALPAVVLVGLGLGPSFPAGNALLSGLVGTTAGAARAFGVQFTVLNASIGLGGLAAASIIDVERPRTFVILYAANALACLVYAAVLPRPAARRVAEAHEDEPSYREVLADPVFRRVCLVSLLFALTGYSALDGGVPAYARVVGAVSPQAIALLFVVNTAVIVLGQLAVLRLLRDVRRSTALAGAALVWALAWALLLAVPALPGPGRVAAVLLYGGVFGLGETLMAPVLGPLVNALATDRLRGRYNAVQGATFSIAFVVGPAVSALLVGSGLGLVWVGLLVAGALASAALATRLRRRLTREQDGVGHVLVPADPAQALVV